MSRSRARTTVTSSPRRLNAGSSSSWLQHSLPMLLAVAKLGGMVKEAREGEGAIKALPPAVEFLFVSTTDCGMDGRKVFLFSGRHGMSD